MAIGGSGAGRRNVPVAAVCRVPPPVPEAQEPDAGLRHHRAFVLSCIALVFVAVFAVPVVFLHVRATTAATIDRAGPAPTTVAVVSGAAGAASGAAPRPLTEAELDAVGEDEGPPAPAPAPPPQTLADACKRLPGYGTIFVEPQPGEEGIEVFEGTFGRRTFFQVVKAHSRDLDAVAAISEAVRRTQLFDFRRIRPDDRYRLFCTTDGTIRMFEYSRSETEMYHVVRAGEASFVAHQVEVPVEDRVTRVAGRVEGALSRSFVAAGLDASIVSLVTDIFSFSINFSRDVRAGDRFRLVVEERWIAGRFHHYTRILAFEYAGQLIGAVKAYAFDVGGRTRFFAADGSSVQRVFLSAPCRYEAISSRFDPNRMHPVLHVRKPHEGIDLVAPTGTPVYAIADGTLAFHGEKGPNGELVVLEHPGEMMSYYAHLSAYAPNLRDGMSVRRGQLIGYVGNTGRSTGPHLHFGIKLHGKFVDPETYLRSRRAQPVPAAQTEAFRARVAELDAELALVPLPAGPAAAAAPATPEVGYAPAADAGN
ncbi:MAG: M23 family metallopeptidase [Deltaproteobacteria bacterium]|nr:M23 family metallopeptidase [Deltaproteobacteria bacterium]